MTDYEPLGKYRLLAELGKGGFATVYRAEDTTLEREVALKVLDPLLLRDGAWVARFRREAKAVANLRHPHIVGIHEIGEAGGRLYIAMELARGGSLAQAIAARGRIPWGETLMLLQPVCDALDYAHGQGVIHRDLKPANILLDPEAGPLLTDFGFARLMSDNSMSMSLSGGILGTPAYIAPEVWELDQAETPADIYALGCIVYEMLMGEVLFGGKTPMQAMRAHDKRPQYPVAWPEGTPEGLTTVLDKALARETAKRYSTAGILWHALSALEVQAESAREAAERAAVAAQWRAEAEAAIAEGEWSRAKMAVGRCLAVTPEDSKARALQAQIARVFDETPTIPAGVPDTSLSPVTVPPTEGNHRNPILSMPKWLWGLIGFVLLGSLVAFGFLTKSSDNLIPTAMPSPTLTAMPTSTKESTPESTSTPIPSPTPTFTPLPTPTSTFTPMPTERATSTLTPTPTVKPTVRSETFSYTVYAQSGWYKTGIFITTGQKVRIRASGNWTNDVGFYSPFGPDGIDAFDSCADIPSAKVGALIGKIGDNGSVFLVGSNLEISASTKGLLYLAMNEGHAPCWEGDVYSNNDGYLNVSITID